VLLVTRNLTAGFFVGSCKDGCTIENFVSFQYEVRKVEIQKPWLTKKDALL
jgi:hypothetical protein